MISAKDYVKHLINLNYMWLTPGVLHRCSTLTAINASAILLGPSLGLHLRGPSRTGVVPFDGLVQPIICLLHHPRAAPDLCCWPPSTKVPAQGRWWVLGTFLRPMTRHCQLWRPRHGNTLPGWAIEQPSWARSWALFLWYYSPWALSDDCHNGGSCD